MSGVPGAELEQQIRRIGVLDEPVRLALYEYVRGQAPADVGRDEAAGAVGISRKLAAFHLDRLVDAGLLEVTFRRLTGRQGPGAGRPAKLYRLAQVEVAIHIPQRAYETAARIFAAALGLRRHHSSSRSLRNAARDAGRAVGVEARQRGEHLPEVLSRQGFEPTPSEIEIRLRNCPFYGLAAEYGLSVCEMNLAYQEGIVDGLGRNHLHPRLKPGGGYCCVVFEHTGEPDAGPAQRAQPSASLRSVAAAVRRLRSK
jgi:predicted ArsR family transcriptional regulator